MQTDGEIDKFQGLDLTCFKHIKEIRYNGPVLSQVLRYVRSLRPVFGDHLFLTYVTSEFEVSVDQMDLYPLFLAIPCDSRA